MADFVVVFPILRSIASDRVLEDEAFRLAAELAESRDWLTLPSLEPQRYTTQFEVLSHTDPRFPRPTKDRRLAYLGRRTKPGFRSWAIGKISVCIDIDPELWKSDSAAGDSDTLKIDYHQLSRQLCAESLTREVFDICCAANLASPGAFEVGASYVYENGELANTGQPVINAFYLAREYATRTSWPRIRALPIEAVFEWVSRLNLRQRLGDTPVSRAYNAWTYQFGPPGGDNPLALFWALMGVEALFNDGREGVREQVLRRSQLLLGERTTHKKDVGEMYQLRSAFVHGGLPFPARDFLYDGMPGFTDFVSRLSNATSIAQAMLAASLQELVHRNVSAIDFATTIRETPI